MHSSPGPWYCSHMKKNESHSHCFHDATKNERAKCRAKRKIEAAEIADRIVALKRSYYANEADGDDIMYALHAIDPELTEGYYDNTKTVEEIIAAI